MKSCNYFLATLRFDFPDMIWLYFIKCNRPKPAGFRVNNQVWCNILCRVGVHRFDMLISVNNLLRLIVYMTLVWDVQFWVMFVCLVKRLFAVFQNHEFPSETELPPGLRGCNQQADQPGAVCLLRLPVYGESLIGVRRKAAE